jgi:hypothetical protein
MLQGIGEIETALEREKYAHDCEKNAQHREQYKLRGY